MDFYKVLSVARHATTSEIKAAYRALALQLHPDVTGNDAAKAKRFQAISNAYNTLSNDEKRRSYDRLIGVQRVSPTAPHASNFYGARPRTSASSSSTSTSASSASSSASRRKTISPEHFNMAAWNAFHYGDNAVATPSVQRKSWMNMKDNAHQNYYAKKAQRAREGHPFDMTKEAGAAKEASKPPPKPKSDECVVS